MYKRERPDKRQREYFAAIANGVREMRETMATKKKAGKVEKKASKVEKKDRGFTPELSDDFEEVSSRREIDGYVRWNQDDENLVKVDGTLLEIFAWRDQDDDERETILVRIKDPMGLTLMNTEDEEIDAETDMVAGLDMKQGLSGLREKEGMHVRIICHGKIEIGKGRTTYQFEVGAKRGAKHDKDHVPFA